MRQIFKPSNYIRALNTYDTRTKPTRESHIKTRPGTPFRPDVFLSLINRKTIEHMMPEAHKREYKAAMFYSVTVAQYLTVIYTRNPAFFFTSAAF